MSSDLNIQSEAAPIEDMEHEETDGEAEEEAAPSIRTNEETGVSELSSLCMNCHSQGITRVMLTTIPFFKELIVMSFECEDCGFKNNEVRCLSTTVNLGRHEAEALTVQTQVQFGGQIQEKGATHTLKVTSNADLDRQIIKPDSASLSIPELEFEIPPGTQSGVVNTIEGFLMKAYTDLLLLQNERREVDATLAAKVDEIANAIKECYTGTRLPFTVVVDDPAGNCFIENPQAPKPDANLSVSTYFRSEAQDLALGLQPDRTVKTEHEPSSEPRQLPLRNGGLDKYVDAALSGEGEDDKSFGHKEVVRLPAPCHSCGVAGDMLMCMTEIPHFKEIIIMSYDCSQCGFRSNEIKAGGAIPPYGEVITLNVTGNNPEDMSRDVLKSDTAGLEIPELEFEMVAGSLGGMYTTVEGLIEKIVENIADGNPFSRGDSALDERRKKLDEFLDQLKALKSGTIPFTLILRDPLANSFVYNPHAPEADPQIHSEKYERTFDENEELGLNDMNVDAFDPEHMKSNPNQSDKEAMSQARGGKPWLDKEQYHPIPSAILDLDTKKP